jgi:CBS domain containing-hemolysin-like protein
LLELVVYVAIAIGLSCYCSILEASFLSITPAFAHRYETDHPKSGARLRSLRAEIDKPLAAILSLNTVAHTAGATGAGAQAAIVFNDHWIGLFSAGLTLGILILSEVIPKTIGVIYWRRLTPLVVRSLPVLVVLTWPLVWLSGLVSGLFNKRKPQQLLRSEMMAMAELGLQEGAIDRDESELIQSTLRFREISVTDVMTPIKVVAALRSDLPLNEVAQGDIPFSRIPVFHTNKRRIAGYVLKDDVHEAHAQDAGDSTLAELQRDIARIPADQTVADALRLFSRQRSHIAVVESETGSALGIITMEDTVETLLGMEIVDEFDPAVDMRRVAPSSLFPLWKQGH